MALEIVSLPKGAASRISIDEETGCWNWTGYVAKNGYGKITYNKKSYKAHRLVYELLVKPIETGLQIDHLCRNRRCVNPTHLEEVTQKENILRGTSPTAENKNKTHCVHGHELSGENLLVSSGGRRVCRICHRKQKSAWKQKNKGSGQVSCELHGSAKLTNKQAASIKLDDRSNAEIAKQYGIDKSTVASIKRGATWKKLKTTEL